MSGGEDYVIEMEGERLVFIQKMKYYQRMVTVCARVEEIRRESWLPIQKMLQGTVRRDAAECAYVEAFGKIGIFAARPFVKGSWFAEFVELGRPDYPGMDNKALFPASQWASYKDSMSDEDLIDVDEEEWADGITVDMSASGVVMSVGAASVWGQDCAFSSEQVYEISLAIEKVWPNSPLNEQEIVWLGWSKSSQVGLATLQQWALAEARLLRIERMPPMSLRTLSWALEPLFGCILFDHPPDLPTAGRAVYIERPRKFVSAREPSRPEIDPLQQGGWSIRPSRRLNLAPAHVHPVAALTKARLSRFRIEQLLEHVEYVLGGYLEACGSRLVKRNALKKEKGAYIFQIDKHTPVDANTLPGRHTTLVGPEDLYAFLENLSGSDDEVDASGTSVGSEEE